MADAQERTEKATDKRMKEARQKGRLAKSTDVTAWLAIAAAAVMLPMTIGAGSDAAVTQAFAVSAAAARPTVGAALRALGDGLGSILPTIAGLLVAVFVVVILGTAVQGGIHLKKFEPKYEQLNIITGLKRTFGAQALWQGAKALLKTAVVGLALYFVIQDLMPIITTPGDHPIQQILAQGADGVSALLQTAITAGVALAAVDVFVVMRRNRKQTRMTKREVKDEFKNTEGDPRIKSQRRSRQMVLSRARMMSAIAEADVVLINPTHYAVALVYEPGKSAPRVVAKGAGNIAAKIREEAETNKVPMVEDIPLTRALHAACELGQEIPFEFYTAVAHVLTFVMALKRRGAAAGVHSLPKTASTLGGR
ncbi:MAG: EscU/YscU/HrcU family type III secretion system export apparatus switch protein [Microbacteriaceae bacterium]|nr:MAG: EscU/YscU/HrcU family type III secretion system export apparatus switch protein [Microbacteriaceae bacterium]